jgi:hypothetical protein
VRNPAGVLCGFYCLDQPLDIGPDALGDPGLLTLQPCGGQLDDVVDVVGECRDHLAGGSRVETRPQQERRPGPARGSLDGLRPADVALDDFDLGRESGSLGMSGQCSYADPVVQEAGNDVAADLAGGTDDKHSGHVLSNRCSTGLEVKTRLSRERRLPLNQRLASARR